MRAYVVERPEGAFTQVDIRRPAPSAGQVLIRVHASGVNPLDTKIRAGKADHAQQRLPAVLGLDMAGVVEEVGPEVTSFRGGDEVYGMVGGVGGRQGTLAEMVVANADLIALKPKSLSMREAAVLPLITITAWEGIVDRAKVHAGHKVLVHAGAGGVGHIAVQLAKAFGAEVFATVSADKQPVVAEFGATTIDYRAVSTEQYVAIHTAGEGFDVVYDTVGGATIDASFIAVKRYTGHVVSCLGWSTHSLAPLSFRGATYSGVFTLMPLLTGLDQAHHGVILREAAALADSGKLRPLLNQQRFSSAENRCRPCVGRVWGTRQGGHRSLEEIRGGGLRVKRMRLSRLCGVDRPVRGRGTMAKRPGQAREWRTCRSKSSKLAWERVGIGVRAAAGDRLRGWF